MCAHLGDLYLHTSDPFADVENPGRAEWRLVCAILELRLEDAFGAPKGRSQVQGCLRMLPALGTFAFLGLFFFKIIVKIMFCDCIGIKMDIFTLYMKAFLTKCPFLSSHLKRTETSFCELLKIFGGVGTVPTVPSGAVVIWVSIVATRRSPKGGSGGLGG